MAIAGVTNATFDYYTFALDNVTWASPITPGSRHLDGDADCVTSSTATSPTGRSSPGGGSGQIQRVHPQANSGTGDTFIKKVLGGAAPPGCGYGAGRRGRTARSTWAARR